MGRPRKYVGEALSTDLRIPMTPTQKALIDRAVGIDGIDKAEWARRILLREAEARIAQADGAKPKRKRVQPERQSDGRN